MAIADAMKNSGRIVAMDKNENRIGLLEKEAARLGVTIVETLKWDATNVKSGYAGIADCVLVDAPCSGLGTARRKPEVKYKAFDEAMKALPQTQAEILRASAEYVKPGGILVDSTCTIAKRENEDGAEAFLSENRDFRLEDMVQLMPTTGDTDGFFICKMQRANAAFGE
jgi:16S rRNA (cytosine967-C5)-methyltransferase